MASIATQQILRYTLHQVFPHTNSAKFFLTDDLVPPGLALLSMHAIYTSSAVAGPGGGHNALQRDIHFGVYDSFDTIRWVAEAPNPQGVNLIFNYWCASGLQTAAASTPAGNNFVALPVDYMVPPGGYIRVWDNNNIDPTGDNIEARLTLH